MNQLPLGIAILMLTNFFIAAAVIFIRSIHLSRRQMFAKKAFRAIQNPGNSREMLAAYDAFRDLRLWPAHGLVVFLFSQYFVIFFRYSELLEKGATPVVRLFFVLDVLAPVLCLMACSFAVFLFWHRKNTIEKL
jgi:hypothetical protein